VAGVLPRRVKFLLVLQSVIIGFLVFWFGEEYENNQYLQAYLNNTIAENGQAYVLLASMVVAILGSAAYARLKIQNMKAERIFRAEIARQARETFALSKRRTGQKHRRETLKRVETSSTLAESESSVIRLKEPEAGVGDQRSFADVSPRVPPSRNIGWTESYVKTDNQTTVPVPEPEALPAQPETRTEQDSQAVPVRPLARVPPLPRHVVARPRPGPGQDRGLAPLSGQAMSLGLNRVGTASPFRPARKVVPSLRGPVLRERGGPPPGLAGAPLAHRVVNQRVGTGPMDNPLPDNPLLPIRRVVSRPGLNRVPPLRPVIPGALEPGPIESTGALKRLVEVSGVSKQESIEEGAALKRVPIAKRADLDDSEGRQASQQSG
jgi:hypothetical protein